MRLFKKVAIIGTGLVGGSLALAIKRKGLAGEIVGVSKHKSSITRAKKIGAIDNGSTGLSIIRGADLIVFAAPVESIIKQAQVVCRLIGPETIVTDVGSTKEKIVGKMEKLFPFFIGSHPLAGSQRRGIDNAQSDLFVDSLCILTPTKKTKNSALNKVSALWRSIGVSTVHMSPSLHDKTLSLTSHLPHALAFALIDSIPKSSFKFSSSGLKGTTRIAASSEELWADIFLSNRKNILSSIGSFEMCLRKIKSTIKSNNRVRLLSILKKAKEKRLKLG